MFDRKLEYLTDSSVPLGIAVVPHTIVTGQNWHLLVLVGKYTAFFRPSTELSVMCSFKRS